MKNDWGSEDTRWMVIGAASAALAGIAVRSALKAGWQLWRDEDPPNNPAAPDVSWKDALAWAGATGAAVAVARVLARRGAVVGWRRVTGRYPPL